MSAVFFLLLAVAISVVGCTLLYLRQRTPKSVEAGIDTFRREMQALAARSHADVHGPGEADVNLRIPADAEVRRRLRKR